MGYDPGGARGGGNKATSLSKNPGLRLGHFGNLGNLLDIMLVGHKVTIGNLMV